MNTKATYVAISHQSTTTPRFSLVLIFDAYCIPGLQNPCIITIVRPVSKKRDTALRLDQKKQ